VHVFDSPIAMRGNKNGVRPTQATKDKALEALA
jgi:hypothetical protein